jgi:hypothetical protein
MHAPHPDTPVLHSLTYRSIAVRPLRHAELAQLLVAARQHNQAEGVTGILLFLHGRFMQYLEGPAEGLDRIFARIQGSALHRDLTGPLREPLAQRAYGDWSMAFLADADHAHPDVSAPSALMAVLEAQPASGAGRVLADFWGAPLAVRPEGLGEAVAQRLKP